MSGISPKALTLNAKRISAHRAKASNDICFQNLNDCDNTN